METKTANIQNVTLILIALGVWALVLQNAGVIETRQDVYVKGGSVEASVRNTLDVNVENQVDVNLSEINGRSSFYDFGGNGEYVRIPVMTGYPMD